MSHKPRHQSTRRHKYADRIKRGFEISARNEKYRQVAHGESSSLDQQILGENPETPAPDTNPPEIPSFKPWERR